MKKRTYIPFLFSLAILAAGMQGVSAQSAPTQVFVTWKASNFYPSYFSGKALPTAGSGVTVSVEAVRNGAPLDLTQNEITWEADGKFFAGGRGMKTASFTASKGAGDFHLVRVTGVRGADAFEGSLRIPVGTPTVSIDAPYPERTADGGSITLRALPFFFNVRNIENISFTWNIEGERRGTGSENFITITSAAARSFPITLEAQNIANGRGEVATARDTFTINP